MTVPSAWTPPRWVRILVHLGGLGVVCHQTVIAHEPNWLLLVVAVVMMGLAGPDLFDRVLPGNRDREHDGDSQ